jgi:fucose permease
MSLFTLMTVASLVVSGMGVAILGSIKVPLARRLDIDEARVGGLVSVFGLVMSPVIFAAGFLTDLVGRQGVLMTGSLFMAASLGLLAAVRRYPPAVMAVVLSSAGWAAMANANNTLVPVAFTGSMAYANNLANVFFGAGAFLTPLGIALLLRCASYSASMVVLGAVVFLPAVLATVVDFSTLDAAGVTATQTGFGSLLRDGVMWLCGLVLLFYSPLEASTSAWATTLLQDKGVGDAAAANYLSGFWLCFMATRLVTAFTLSTGCETLLIVALSVLSIAVLTGLVLVRSGKAAGPMVLTAGLVYGPIFPTLMAVLLSHFDRSLHGRAVGLLFGIGGVGWTVVPMLIGAYARRAGVQRGFTVAVGSAVGLSVVAAVLLYIA